MPPERRDAAEACHESRPPAPLVGVVVVVFEQSDEEISRFAGALGSLTYANFHVYFVNNSPGRDPRYLIKGSHFHPVSLIESGGNLGFTGGANVGIASALADGCSLALLLNTDVEFLCPEMIQRLLGPFFIDQSCGMVSPVITQAPKCELIWYSGADVGAWSGIPRHPGLGRRYRPVTSPEAQRTPVSNGCCVLISGRMFEELGGFDDEFFAYFDEVDLSVRARSAGYHIYLWPEAMVGHYKSGRTLSSVEAYYMTRNALIFVRKHMTPFRLPIAVLCQITVALPAYLIRSRSRKAKAAWMRGVRDGFRALFDQHTAPRTASVAPNRGYEQRPSDQASDDA